MREPIRNIVIAGGGTAGWMAAAALSQALSGTKTQITLVESEEIGTVGVGEATTPAIHFFNSRVGVDQADFMRTCQATFKLGVEFVDWGDIGRRYIHPFTPFGRDLNNVFFHELWLKYAELKAAQGETLSIDDYNLCSVAARHNRFSHPVGGARGFVAPLNYAFHFDASLYAKYLRKLSEQRGVVRLEGKIVDIQQESETGFLQALVLDDGRKIEGDLFLDCTGQRAILIEQTLKTGYIDWRSWLPCDTAVAVQTANVEAPVPYTRSTADEAGWRWRIPLQHRVGNGYVYSSRFTDHESAQKRLLEKLDAPTVTEPRRIHFVPGRRQSFWVKNCVAIGLASGFLEPLESTSIHLIQTGVLKLLALFPDKGFEPADIAAFNGHTEGEYERLRDFLLLHYKITRRTDTPFWRHCREMQMPESVQRAMDLFESRGRMMVSADNFFSGPSWLSVMLGQGLRPRGYDPLANTVSETELENHMRAVRDYIDQTVKAMPAHDNYLARFCGSTSHVA